MVKFVSLLSRLNQVKILVVGDMLLDSYTIGKARRISPEAPVAVIEVQEEGSRPGGAGNVILNLISLGASVVAMGRVGNDLAGDTFCNALKNEGVDVKGIFIQHDYKTPVKNRVIANSQQIVRIDYEQSTDLDPFLEQQLISQLRSYIEDVKVIAISDYGKGFLTPAFLRTLISLANEKGIPLITDPKGDNFSKYKGTTAIKPNLAEAYAAAKLPSSATLEEVAQKILDETQVDLLMITRSEKGISLFNRSGQREDFPASIKEVKDVTGAGDTVLAMFVHALANGLSYSETAKLCNIAASIAIDEVGCARVSLSHLAHRLIQTDMVDKIFDEEHQLVLQQILKTKPFSLLVIKDQCDFSYPLFQLIQDLSQKSEMVVVYIEDKNSCQPLIEVLASLRGVSFIVAHKDNLDSLYAQKMLIHTHIYEPKAQLNLVS